MWTILVPGLWRKLGEGKGYSVFSKRNPVEFLVDLCWLRGNDEAEPLWMQLALECEWGAHNREDFVRDFRKLVMVKALNKVLVFDALGDHCRTAENLAREVGRSRVRSKEESYLLIALEHVSPSGEQIVAYSLDPAGNLTVLDAGTVLPRM